MPLVRSRKMRLRLSSRTMSAWAFGKRLDEVADLCDDQSSLTSAISPPTRV